MSDNLQSIRKEREHVPEFMYIDRLEEYCERLETIKQKDISVITDYVIENQRLKESMQEIIKTYEYGQPDHDGEVMVEVEDTCDAMFNIAQSAIR
ncbi:TPA: hypothetical protein ACOQ39_005593 [Bacillus cereus]|uniref:hypothetical protein n=1 Tax=Bacillus cereus TaxID=1396 RepID=UPI000BFC1916|nr:hypothetical protein [Bacillus cereus]PGR17962.1 hypothetical protein COC50_25235 [Bacillus anthracis]MBL3880860.1 hypothetical protein [Bacillus cereus]HDR7977124.1 hypothetical protein [Bacillus cereus]HDR8073783.1 hypothetical protein [Bacillus cereus]HDR8216147.1 hypothetical protein [Bacillus cereus]